MSNKGLFILHGFNFVYGAGRSISNFLKLYDRPYDIMVSLDSVKALPGEAWTEAVRNSLGPNLQKIIIVHMLPYEYCFIGHDKRSGRDKVIHFFYSLAAGLYKKRIYKIFEREQYEFIHLNDIVLYPLLNARYHMFLHMRTIYNRKGRLSRQRIMKKLSRARGVIFIDKGVKREFPVLPCPSVILNNPFDMRSVARIKKEAVLEEYGIQGTEVVFSMIGVVSEGKGSGFVIDAFMKVKNDNLALLIVGEGENPYYETRKRAAEADKRIRFLGEIKQIEKIYAISDVIIRGDLTFGMGRTVYEGLFSGCRVILPGCGEDRKDIVDGEGYQERLFLYEPRNQEALMEQLERCGKEKAMERHFESNIEEYQEKLSRFLHGKAFDEEENGL